MSLLHVSFGTKKAQKIFKCDGDGCTRIITISLHLGECLEMFRWESRHMNLLHYCCEHSKQVEEAF